MATSIIKYDGDTSWSHGNTTSTTNIYYRRKNGFCTITAQISGELVLDATEKAIMTLGADYAPTQDIFFSITNRGSNTQGAYGRIDGNGVLYGRSPVGSASYLNFCVTYPIK